MSHKHVALLTILASYFDIIFLILEISLRNFAFLYYISNHINQNSFWKPDTSQFSIYNAFYRRNHFFFTLSLCTNLLVSRIWGRFLFTILLSESGDSHSHSHSDQGGFCRTYCRTNLSNILSDDFKSDTLFKSDKTLCPTWEYDRWYTWRDL